MSRPLVPQQVSAGVLERGCYSDVLYPEQSALEGYRFAETQFGASERRNREVPQSPPVSASAIKRQIDSALPNPAQLLRRGAHDVPRKQKQA
jgi:hypothetical protein